jgi:hypothetical protein
MSALPRPLLLGVLVPATTKSAYSWDDSALNTAEGEGEDDYFDEEMGFAGQVSDAASKNASAIAWNDAWDADEAGDAGYSGYDSSGGSGGTAAGAGATSNAYGYPPGSGGRLPPTPTSSLEAFLDSDIAKLVRLPLNFTSIFAYHVLVKVSLRRLKVILFFRILIVSLSLVLLFFEA